MAGTHKGWSRGSIGYRDAQLDSSDFTAAMTLFVAGVPALLIGSELALQGVGLGQMILAAPLGVLVGALVVGLLGRQAAASGVPSVYLARAAFGSLGSIAVRSGTDRFDSCLGSADVAGGGRLGRRQP